MAGNLSDQVLLQNQINKIIKDRNTLIKQQNSLMTKQAKLAHAVAEAAKGKGLGELNKALKSTNNEARQLNQNLPAAANQMRDMGSAASESADKLDQFNKRAIAMGAVLGGLRGLKKGIGALKSIVSGTFKVLGTFVTTIFNIGKAIISIPFKIFGALVSMSQQMGSPAFRQALEEVRASFGAIGRTKVREQIYSLRKQIGGLSIESNVLGLTFGRIFGYGPEGMAKAAKENLELANHLGGSFLGLADRLKTSGKLLVFFRKGMGFTTEQQATLIKLTEKSGGVFEDRMENLAKLTDAAADGFNLSSKEVGKTVGLMFDDVKTFGNFTDKQMINMATQSRRLGVDLKALQRVASGFDDYEKAQKNVAFLNRSFGMTVDTMKLFREQDPVKRIQMLQKSFKATGRDINKMQRQELEYFANAAEMSEKDAKIIFAKKNLEMDYNAVKKVTNKAEKKSVTTAQVLLKLSKQIERVFGSGGQKSKGFFDKLIHGFGRGIYYTTEFRQVMYNLRRSLMLTGITGRTMGRNFVKHFPGVKQLLGALADFFDPKKFLPTLRQMNRHMKEFYLNLGQGKTVSESLDILLMRMKRTFVDFYGGKGGAIEQMKKAFDIIATLVINLKLEIMSRVVDAASSGLDAFGDVLSMMMMNPNAVIGGAAEAGGGMFADRFGKSANKLLSKVKFKLMPAVKRNAPVIFDALMKLLELARGYIMKNADKIGQMMLEMYMLSFKLKLSAMKAVFGGGLETALIGGAVMFAPAIGGALSMIVSGIMMRGMAKAAATSAVAAATGTGVAAKAGLGASMAKMGGGLVRGIGGALRTAITFGGRVSGPIGMAITAAVMTIGGGVYHAFKAKKGQSRFVEAGKGMVSGLVYGITMGMVSHEDLWGKYFEDPLSQALYDLERGGGHYGKMAAKSVRNIQKSSADLIKHNKLLADFAKNSAKLGKLMYDPDNKEDRQMDAFIKSNRDKINKLSVAKKTQSEELALALHGEEGALTYLSTHYDNMADYDLDGDSPEFALFRKIMSPDGAFYKRQSRETKAMLRKLRDSGGDMDDAFFEGTKYSNDHLRNSKIREGIDAFRANTTAEIKRLEREHNALAGSGKGSLIQGYVDFAMSGSGGHQTERQALSRYYSYQRKHYAGLLAQGSVTEDEMNKKLKVIVDRLDKSKAKIKAKVTRSHIDGVMKQLTADYADPITGEIPQGLNMPGIRKQAEEMIAAALQSGDLSKITSEALREKIAKQMKALGEGSVLDKAQSKKLDALEAAKTTVERIKALSSIPDELKELSKKLKGLDEKKIKAKVDQLFKTAKIIAEAVNAGSNTHLKKLIDSPIDMQTVRELTTRLDLITKISSAVRGAVGTAIPGKSRINDRVGLIAHTITKIAEKFGKKEIKAAIKLFKSNDFTPAETMLRDTGKMAKQVIEVTSKSLASKKTITTYVNRLYDAVEGFAGVFTDVYSLVKFAPVTTFQSAILTMTQAQQLGNSIPKFASGYSRKVQAAKSVLAGVTDMLDDVTESVNKANLTGTVDLIQAMNAGGELKMSLDSNTNLNATIVLKVSAEELGKAIVATPMTHNGKTGDYISTQHFPSGIGRKKSGQSLGSHGE